MFGRLTSSWHQSDITDVISSSSRLALHCPARWLRSLLASYPTYKKSTSRESFHLCWLSWPAVRGEVRVLTLYYISDTSDTYLTHVLTPHILTNEWQSDQNIWTIKTENNIQPPTRLCSHWLPSLTQLASLFLSSLSSNKAECPLDANICRKLLVQDRYVVPRFCSDVS